MKRLIALFLTLVLALGLTTPALAKKNTQMNDGVPVWTEETVRQYALDFVEGKSMSRLWGYYDLQIRRYMPMTTYEALLTELEWMTGAFIELGTYRSFDEPERKTRTHVLHLCMEKQDLDMYFTHKNKEDDWEIMAVQFVPSEKQLISDGRDMLVGGEGGGVLAPDNYTETEISVVSADCALGGTLTMPAEASAGNPVPACVLVHDQGALDRNSTMGQTAFFADLAHALAKMGIASVRYDKRTFTYGETKDMTVWEEVVEDAVSAGKLLQANPRVDRERIVVIGHGFGASLTPRIVSQADGLFSAMIMIGGTSKTYLEILLEESADEMAAMDEAAVEQLKAAIRKMSSMKESQARELTLFGKNGYYFWEMEQYDPIQLLKKLKLPTYIVQGQKDPVVSESDGWRAYSEAIGDNITFVSFKSFRGLNHLLMKDLSESAKEKPEYNVAATLDTQAGRNLSQWILGLFAQEEEE